MKDGIFSFIFGALKGDFIMVYIVFLLLHNTRVYGKFSKITMVCDIIVILSNWYNFKHTLSVSTKKKTLWVEQFLVSLTK